MYKNQYILTICAVLGFLYTLFFYYQNSKLESIKTLNHTRLLNKAVKNQEEDHQSILNIIIEYII